MAADETAATCKVHGSQLVVSRRELLRVGGLAGLGIGLPQLLAGQPEQSAEKRYGGTAKSCIFVVLSGGPSHLDTFDPKPDAPREIRGPYDPISTAVPGVLLSEKLPALAKVADRFTLLRSMSHRDGVHVTAAHTMLTAQPDGRRRNNSPFVGSLIARFRPSRAAIPSYVWLHNMKTGTRKVPRYESGLNNLGYQYAPLRVGHELDNPSSPDFRVSVFDPPDGLTTRDVNARFDLLNRLEATASPAADSPAGRRFQTFQERARRLVTGPQARRAFDVRREPDRMRDRYGRHPLGQYCLMARRLIEAGVRLVTVTAWPGLAPGETKPTVTQVWDTHDIRYRKSGDSMYGNGPFGMKWSLPRLDQAVAALLGDLDERGLLDETLVIITGEFGRTPKFEGKGRGRGHWPNCYTGILAGGGVRRGTVYGSSDRHAAYVAGGRPVSHVDFGATVFHALGIPPETRWGPDGFSFRVNNGRPVRELFV